MLNKKRESIQKLKDKRKCQKCHGTGLSNISYMSDGTYSWDGHSFCDNCNGTGYLKWKDGIEIKMCPTCKGSGGECGQCPSCHGEGILDWIQYMKV